MKNPADIKELIVNCIDSDQKAIARLVSTYEDYVYSICFSVLNDRHLAQEAAQDTFVKTFRSLSNYGENAAFSTWIYAIAYRTAIDYTRKQKSVRNLKERMSQILQILPLASYSKPVIEKEIGIEELLGLLKPNERMVIKLYYYKEFSVAEISEFTGFTSSKIKVTLMRARNKLKEIIAETYKGEIKMILE